MQLQDITTNLEISRKLKELGVPQESYFYWSKAMDNKFWRIENSQFFAIDKRRDVSAFTETELGRLLPDWITTFRSGDGYYYCKSESEINKELDIEFVSERPQDAKAKMLIYLIEQKLIDVSSLTI